MDFAALIPLLRDLSPYVAIVLIICGAVGYFVYRKYNWKEKLLATRESVAAKESAAAEKATQLMILDKVTQVQTDVAVTRTQLAEHMQDHNASVDVLKGIHHELIRMNAQPGKVISPDNAKLIILYQWNWCRDETARILINSITNNHYYGNEEKTAQKVLGAWKDAARDALRSVVALDGFSYPVEPLFEQQTKRLWAQAWAWAVPVYQRYSGRPIEGKAAYEELTAKVKEVFDQTYEAYIDAVEDIDSGLVYRHEERDLDTDEHGLTFTRMAGLLKQTGAVTAADETEPEAIKKTVKQSLEQYKKKNKIRRTKSGLIDLQEPS